MRAGDPLDEWVPAEKEGQAKAEELVFRDIVRDRMEAIVDRDPARRAGRRARLRVANDALAQQGGKGKAFAWSGRCPVASMKAAKTWRSPIASTTAPPSGRWLSIR